MANAFDQFDTRKNPFDKFGGDDPTAASVGGNFLAGFNERVDDVITFIPNTIKAGVQVAQGRGDEVFVPEKTAFSSVAETVEPRNKAERISRQAGSMTGDAITGLGVGAVSTPAKMTQQGITTALNNPTLKNTAKLIVDDIANFFRANPGKATTEEALMSALGGLGFAAAAEETDNPLLQTSAGIASGSSPKIIANSATGMAFRGGKWLASRMSRDAQQKAARNEVKAILGQEITPEASQKIETAGDLESQIPGLELSLAEKTEAPSLAAMQRSLEERATGAELEHYAARREGNALAIQQYARSSAPKAEPTPDYIVETVGGRLDDIELSLDSADANLASRSEAVAESIPTTDRAQSGQAIRARFKELKSAKSEEMSKLAKELKIDDIDVTQPFVLFTKNLTDELKPQSELSDSKNIPDAMTDLAKVVKSRVKNNAALKKAGKQEQPFTFSDIKAFRERVGDAIRDEMQAANPKTKKVRDLVIAKKRLDGFIDELADNRQIPEELAEGYNAFRKAYKLEYIDKYENGAAFKLKQRGQGDFYKTLDEKVADVFFQPGGITRAREFKAAFDGDREAYDALEASVLDKMKASVVKDGRINQASFNGWLTKHDSVLREFPELKQKIGNIQAAQAEILGRQAQIDARRKFLETRALRRKINSVRKNSRTPEAVLQDTLKNPKVLDQVIRSIRGDEAAENGFKRWVWDQATSGKPSEIKKFIFDQEAILKKVLGDGHFENIKTILKAEDAIAVVPPSQGQDFKSIPFRRFEETTGISIPSAINRGYALQSGRVQKQWLWAEGIMKSLNAQKQKELDALMKRALYDPEFAKMLAQPSAKARPEQRRKLNAYLYQMGIEPLFTEQETE